MGRKLRVMMVSEEGRGGGPLKRMRLVAEKLKSQLDTTIVCPAGSDVYISSLQDSQVSYETIQMHPITRHAVGLWKFIWGFRTEVKELKKLILKIKPDIVHANGSWQYKAVIAAHQLNIPCIWHMNDSHQPGIIKRIYKRLAQLAEYRIYASNVTKNYYEALHVPTLSKIIHAPVLIHEYHEKLYKKGQPINIITVAYVSSNKRIEIMIKTIGELLKYPDSPEVHLYIIGPIIDSQVAYFQSLQLLIQKVGIEENVHFEGHQNNVSEYLHKSDVYLCTSGFESSPMAVWEAMSHSVPVVSTDVGDLREMNETLPCVTLASEEPKSLAAAVIHIISDTEERTTKTRNAHQLMRDQFTLSQHTELYLQFCNRIAVHAKNNEDKHT